MPKSKGRRKPADARRRQTGSRSRGKPTDKSAAPVPNRTTRPPAIRVRPTWHRVVGGVQIALGLVVIVVNYAQVGGTELLPGGHSEIYFVLGLLIAGAGSWWFGIFDRPS